jgi:hypothetical protein
LFLSEPRFEKLPCVLETGSEDGSISADDVALAFKLRKRGAAARARRTGGAGASRSPKAGGARPGKAR